MQSESIFSYHELKDALKSLKIKKLWHITSHDKEKKIPGDLSAITNHCKQDLWQFSRTF